MDKREGFLANLGLQVVAAAGPAGVVAATNTTGAVLVAAAAAFPVLVSSLPAQRQQARLQEWQRQVSEDLGAMNERLDRLTDDQYHLINEVISAASQTLNSEKLSYLRTVIRKTVLMDDLASQEASLLGRLIRDLSAHEAQFICEKFGHEYIFIGKKDGRVPKTWRVEENSSDSLVVKGLVGLGVLDMVGGDGHLLSDDFGDGAYFTFSQLAAKLIVLLRTSAKENA